MDEPTDPAPPASSDGVLIGEAASHGGLLGLAGAAVAALLAFVVVAVRKRRAQ